MRSLGKSLLNIIPFPPIPSLPTTRVASIWIVYRKGFGASINEGTGVYTCPVRYFIDCEVEAEARVARLKMKFCCPLEQRPPESRTDFPSTLGVCNNAPFGSGFAVPWGFLAVGSYPFPPLGSRCLSAPLTRLWKRVLGRTQHPVLDFCFGTIGVFVNAEVEVRNSVAAHVGVAALRGRRSVLALRKRGQLSPRFDVLAAVVEKHRPDAVLFKQLRNRKSVLMENRLDNRENVVKCSVLVAVSLCVLRY